MTYLVSYDISDTKKRTKLSNFLEKKGRRLQKSLFLIELKKSKLNYIKRDIENIMKDEGDIIIIPLCKGCAERVEKYGAITGEYLIF